MPRESAIYWVVRPSSCSKNRSLFSALLDRHYPTAAHYHCGAALIESVRHNGLSTAGDLFINIHSQRVEILYFDQTGTLRIYNSYEYRTYQDYIYFVLLVADEMQLDRDSTRAVLLKRSIRTHSYTR
jgi:hypothetical protein